MIGKMPGQKEIPFLTHYIGKKFDSIKITFIQILLYTACESLSWLGYLRGLFANIYLHPELKGFEELCWSQFISACKRQLYLFNSKFKVTLVVLNQPRWENSHKEHGQMQQISPCPILEDWLLNIYCTPQSICQRLESKKHVTHDRAIPVS